MTPKHVPLRTCVQCRQVRSKRELIRIVRTPQGTIEIDERGKMAGRGAYLCRNRTCWEGAIGHERLGHALQTKLSAADEQRLCEYGQRLPCMATVSPKAVSSRRAGTRGPNGATATVSPAAPPRADGEATKTQGTVPEKGDKAAATVQG